MENESVVLLAFCTCVIFKRFDLNTALILSAYPPNCHTACKKQSMSYVNINVPDKLRQYYSAPYNIYDGNFLYSG